MPNHYLSQESIDELKKILRDDWFSATKEQWQEARIHYDNAKCRTIANWNAIRFSQASEKEKEAQIEQQIRTFNIFLFLIEFCIAYNPKNRNGSFHSRLIEGLLTLGENETIEKQEINENINVLLSDFLTFNPREVIEYYTSFLQIKLDAIYTENENGDLVYLYLPIMVHFGNSVIDYYLITLDKILAFQSPPEGIINLIDGCVENPPLFAALLIWVLNKGVEPNVLINAGLLHTFMKATIYDIARENSSINLLFKWLEMRKDNFSVISLINLAATISCKSTDCADMRGFEHYALTGHKSAKGAKELKAVRCQLPDLNLTPNYNNIANLYNHFDILFLEKILDYLSNKISRQENDPEIIHCLNAFFRTITLFNGQGKILELIRRFSKISSEGKREFLFKALENVLTCNAISDLLEKDVSAICVAQHANYFSNILIDGGLCAFAERIIQSQHHVIDKIKYLIILLKKSPNNRMLFKCILNYFLLAEENIAAALFTINSKSFAAYNDDIMEILKEYKEIYENKIYSFNIEIENIINPLTEDICNEIEGCWSLFFHQLELAEHISNIKVEKPFKDKYTLKSRIIILYCFQNRSQEDIKISLLALIGNANYDMAVTLIYAETLLAIINEYKNQAEALMLLAIKDECKHQIRRIDFLTYLITKNDLFCYIMSDLAKSKILSDTTAKIFIEKTMQSSDNILAELLGIPETYTLLCNSLFDWIKNNSSKTSFLIPFSKSLPEACIINYIEAIKSAPLLNKLPLFVALLDRDIDTFEIISLRNEFPHHITSETLPTIIDGMLNEKNYLDDIFIYLVVEHARLLKGKITQFKFDEQLNDFCCVVKIIETIINKEFLSNEQKATPIERLLSHISGSQHQSLENCSRENRNRFTFFSTSADDYRQYRESILKLSADTLLVRYRAFREAMLQWANNISIFPSSRTIAGIVCQQFITLQPHQMTNNNSCEDQQNLITQQHFFS